MEVVVPESLYQPSTQIVVGLERISVNVATQSLDQPTFSVNVGVESLSCRLSYTERDTVITALIAEGEDAGTPLRTHERAVLGYASRQQRPQEPSREGESAAFGRGSTLHQPLAGGGALPRQAVLAFRLAAKKPA